MFNMRSAILIVIFCVSFASAAEQQARISHSGPNIPNRRQKRASVLSYFDNLLLESVPPTGSLKQWLLDEHNKYRKMVLSLSLLP